MEERRGKKELVSLIEFARGFPTPTTALQQNNNKISNASET